VVSGPASTSRRIGRLRGEVTETSYLKLLDNGELVLYR
jgi:hypothetical protein